ncbi:PDCD5-related protein [Piptocephalis cylindrospora]|uniref:PDCD5-related protein n=1 Tax=Piptocephalis cylindrospora TaxID=1907219 RepID=A0A4P9Y4B5_9FUNG|nr:PDCD5-related protein [Piptocephalis cylindrospora]|eukprot:RKP13755.1 PDCD5-related protein [Piptocephalis cylindrospora]
MSDPELDAIRARRLAELQGQSAKQGSSPSPLGGLPSPGRSEGGGEDEEAAAERRGREEEMRRAFLTQLLDPQARERLNRIAIVKKEKARAVEDLLIKTAQRGGLRGRVSEPQLIELLGQLSQQSGGGSSQQSSKIIYNRRRFGDSDDDDEWE